MGYVCTEVDQNLINHMLPVGQYINLAKWCSNLSV